LARAAIPRVFAAIHTRSPGGLAPPLADVGEPLRLVAQDAGAPGRGHAAVGRDEPQLLDVARLRAVDLRPEHGGCGGGGESLHALAVDVAVDSGRATRDVRVEHAGGHVGEHLEGFLLPKRLPTGLAFRRRSFGDGVRAGKRIDDGALMSYLEMKMRKFRVAREPDCAE